MERYKRVGLTEEMTDPSSTIRAVSTSFDVVERQDIIDFLPSQRVFDSSITAIRHYLREDLANTRVWADNAVMFAEAYFFGDWRDRALTGNGRDQPPDRKWWDVHATWQSEFTAAMLWGSVLGCWDRLARIAGAIRDDVRLGIEQTEQNRAWLLIVAGHLRGRPWAELAPFIETVRTGRRRERLLLAWLTANREGDLAAINRAAQEYAAYYLRAEAKIYDILCKLMIDGSFLYHDAGRAGHRVDLPAVARDRLITL
jgi:hypothetical protein